MEIRKFVKKDMEELNWWLSVRDLPAAKFKIPKLAYMSHIENVSVACLFLRRIEGGFGLIDGLCTNPEAVDYVRNNAINELLFRAIYDAKAVGIKAIMAFVSDEHTLTRAASFDFITLNDKCIIRSI
jgi:hypothetical protein